jgi:hypothetical protein
MEVDQKDQPSWDMFPDFPARAKFLMEILPKRAAEWVLQRILTLLPKKDFVAQYRRSLVVAKVEGGEAAFAVYSNTRKARGKQINAVKSLLYVIPTRVSKKTPESVTVMQKWGPWTVGLLPYTPPKDEATILVRKVNRREVEMAEKRLRRTKREWRKALSKAGVRHKQKIVIQTKQARMIPDMVFEALRLEFGQGGQKATPHWKPSIQQLVSTGISGMLTRDKMLQALFTDPSFKGWETLPKARYTIRVAEAQRFVAFQKRLGF